MTIKNDRWIREMAKKGMIEPFEENQVRDDVISYGVSSYGYDLRVADTYKIFTNVNNTIVDPKSFNEKSFIEYKGDYCIVPPNSFALAHSVEYFRIPRNILTICLGKSTYARCFRGDTKVALANGKSISLEKMAEEHQKGEVFFGYSINRFGKIEISLLDNPRFIGRDSLLEITLDNNEKIYCTPDHKFLLRDGVMEEAHKLRVGTSLMPLYRDLYRGYESVYQPLTGNMYPTHRLSDEFNLKLGVYEDEPNTHRHHIDFNRINNYPTNITRINASEHIKMHNNITYTIDFDPEEHGKSVKEAYKKLKLNPEWNLKYSQQQRVKAINFWNDSKYFEARRKLIEKRKNPSDEYRKMKSEMKKNYYINNPHLKEVVSIRSKKYWSEASQERLNKQKEIAKNINIRNEIDEFKVREALDITGSIRGAARYLDCDRSVFRRFPDIIDAFRGCKQIKNHKITSIKEIAGTHDVYCLTVPEYGNFALDAGIFVHNCGIIVNVTPFEPEWEGFVTLEISNTTPLPAKIYSNEGLAQVLFFEADEPCEISYKDKKGKYQLQRGITLPRL
ncbi:MAG: dCTP deaminase [Candidatus Sericytochromatia bacterium]